MVIQYVYALSRTKPAAVCASNVQMFFFFLLLLPQALTTRQKQMGPYFSYTG